MQLAPMEIIGKLELIGYLREADRAGGVLVIGSCDSDWSQRFGVIPGAVLIPWQRLHLAHTEADRIAEAD